jgi:16S rRNA (cytidine1402-2'-O)-methyltransferase
MKTLFVITTPIGNLGDLSPRAAEILRRTTLLLCEDTRRAKKLLKKVGAEPKTIPFHRHNAKRCLAKLEKELLSHDEVSFLTDAGAPNVSDPGCELVKWFFEREWKVVPIPGPSAVTTLLSVSPYPASEFLFLGFLPDNKRRFNRSAFLIEFTNLPTVLFISPHDGKKLALLEETIGDRTLFVGREMTKLHEEYYTTTLSALRKSELKGELTVLVLPQEEKDHLKRLAKNLLSLSRKEFIRLSTGGSFAMISEVLEGEERERENENGIR